MPRPHIFITAQSLVENTLMAILLGAETAQTPLKCGLERARPATLLQCAVQGQQYFLALISLLKSTLCLQSLQWAILFRHDSISFFGWLPGKVLSLTWEFVVCKFEPQIIEFWFHFNSWQTIQQSINLQLFPVIQTKNEMQIYTTIRSQRLCIGLVDNAFHLVQSHG